MVGAQPSAQAPGLLRWRLGAQPDPIDFRRYQLLNIYEDANAFTQPLGAFNVAERPFRRSVEGQVVWTARQLSRFEEVLGTRGRSGYQLEAWEANYGPVGSDGISEAPLGQAHRRDRQRTSRLT
jgi:hypothetical protein